MGRLKISESLNLKGRITVRVWDANKYPTYEAVKEATRKGEKPLEEQKISNLIVTAGKNFVADLLIAAVTGSFTHCGVGSSTQAPAAGDTALTSQIGSRKTATDRFRTNNIATFSTFFGSADNNGTWNEVGVFTAATGGTMLNRALFTSAITKDTSKTITVDVDCTVG